MGSHQQQRSTNFNWHLLGDTMVTLTLPGEIAERVWGEYMAALTGGKVRQVISLTIGESTLKPTQRKEAADALKIHGIGAIVITDSHMTRGIITAVAWLGVRGVDAFKWADLEQAIAAAKLSPEHEDELRQLARGLQRRSAAAASG